MKKLFILAAIIAMICSPFFCGPKAAEHNFTWTAPPDFRDSAHRDTATVGGYEMRMCITADTSEFDWDNPTRIIPYIGPPKPPGMQESILVADLQYEVPMVFAIKAYDDLETPNWSNESNKILIVFHDGEPPQAVVDLK